MELIMAPHQLGAIDNAHRDFKAGHTSLLMVIGTGGGKTAIASMICNHVSQGYGAFQKGRTLFIANRKNLVHQSAKEIHRWSGIACGIEQGEWEADLDSSVVVASVDSLANRLERYPKDHYELIIWDESHLQVGQRAQKVMEHFNCKRLGLTATPHNKGKRSLAKFYEHITIDLPLHELIKIGWAAPLSVAMCPLRIDLSNVRQTKGDLDTEDLSAAITPYFDAICQEMLNHPHRQWLCLTPNIQSSKDFSEALNRNGIRAKHVDGASDNEDAIRGFGQGEFDAITCSQLLYFGWDCPRADGLVNLRQTKSRNFYEQAIGRISRKSEDTLKHEGLILDFLYQYPDMGLVRPPFVLCENKEDAAEMQKCIEKSVRPMDLMELREAVEKDRYAKLKQKLHENEKKKGKIISVLDIIKSEERDELLEEIYSHVPSRPPTPMSQAQRMVLERHSVDIAEVQNAEHAAAIISWLHNRLEAGMASLRQLRLLKRLGMESNLSVTYKYATRMLDKRLAHKNT